MARNTPPRSSDDPPRHRHRRRCSRGDPPTSWNQNVLATRTAGSSGRHIAKTHGRAQRSQTAARSPKREGSVSLRHQASPPGRELHRQPTHILNYCDDPVYRRDIQRILNRGESRNGLARDVFHGGGKLAQRYQTGQENQLGALGLLVRQHHRALANRLHPSRTRPPHRHRPSHRPRRRRPPLTARPPHHQPPRPLPNHRPHTARGTPAAQNGSVRNLV